MERYGIIYKITNRVNGKVYVGQTVQSLSDRWSKHKYKKSHSKLVRQAISKYGVENLTIDEICSCFDYQGLNDLERHFIIMFRSLTPHGYNLNDGGDNSSSTPESRKNRSEAAKRHWSNPQTRAKHIEALRNPERTSKIGKTAKERWSNPEFKRKVSESIRKASCSLEHRIKMSEARKLAGSTPEAKAKRSLASKKNWKNPKYVAAFSEKRKSQWQNPEYRNKILSAIRRSNENRSRPVIGTNISNGECVEYPSTQAVQTHGYSQGHVYSCCIGKRKSHKGYIWRFKNGT
jgi:group I intron endonuclease